MLLSGAFAVMNFGLMGLAVTFLAARALETVLLSLRVALRKAAPTAPERRTGLSPFAEE